MDNHNIRSKQKLEIPLASSNDQQSDNESEDELHQATPHNIEQKIDTVGFDNFIDKLQL